MDCKIGVILLSLYYPCAFLEFLEPIIAIGDSLRVVQHEASLTRKCGHEAFREALDKRIASLTRKSRPSVASNYQAGFCSQGIKRPARMSPAFDGLYF